MFPVGLKVVAELPFTSPSLYAVATLFAYHAESATSENCPVIYVFVSVKLSSPLASVAFTILSGIMINISISTNDNDIIRLFFKLVLFNIFYSS